MSSAHIWPFIALAFCTWAVSLAGIASLQEDCTDTSAHMLGAAVNGFSAVLGCKEIYRYYWFIVSLEFVLIAILGAFLASGNFGKARVGLVGLISVATLLYIQMTDAFLSAEDFEAFKSGSARDRLRTMIAGSLMTATANCFLILAAGYETEVHERREEAREEKTAV